MTGLACRPSWRRELGEGSIREPCPSGEICIAFDGLVSCASEVGTAQWNVKEVERTQRVLLLAREVRKKRAAVLPVCRQCGPAAAVLGVVGPWHLPLSRPPGVRSKSRLPRRERGP